MWTDERGSELLGLLECRRLLALGAKEGRHGHLGLPDDAGPIVLPVNYAMHGPDVVLLVGEHLFARLAGSHVAFQVDGLALPHRYLGEQDSRRWSVLVRGLAIEEAVAAVDGHVPVPEVLVPGSRVVRIRADAVSGRRFGVVPSPAATVGEILACPSAPELVHLASAPPAAHDGTRSAPPTRRGGASRGR